MSINLVRNDIVPAKEAMFYEQSARGKAKMSALPPSLPVAGRTGGFMPGAGEPGRETPDP